MSFGAEPFIKLESHNEKNRKGSVIPLRPDLAEEHEAWVASKSPIDLVFNVPTRILAIMNLDLKLAGIPKRDADGCVVHIHALRHTTGTHLSKAGVAPRSAQAVMRHSSLDQTMNTYTDPRLLGTFEAVEALPSFEAPRNVAPNVAPKLGKGGHLESGSVNLGDDDDDSSTDEKTPQTQGFTAFDGVGATRRLLNFFDMACVMALAH